jgi:predicted dehydrogenase
MSLQPPIRIGVIGAGSFASRRHCPDIVEHPEAQLSALCRRDPEQLQKMADAFSVEHTYTDYRELIDSNLVDAVLISSPHDLHYEHGKAALTKGLHVLLEKPITTEAQQGHELVALAKEKGLALIVAQNPPYWNHCRHLRQQFRDGRLGELESASINWVGNALAVLGLEALPDKMPGVVPPTLYRASAAQNGGGFTMDGGTHLLCELLWCTERRVVEVSAQMDNADFDVRCSLSMRLDNGALVSLNQVADSRIRAKRQHNIYYGSKGTAVVRGFPFTIEIEAGGEVERLREDELPDAPTPVGDFVDCVLSRSNGEISGDTAVHVVEVLRAAQEAARMGQNTKV